MNRVAKFAVSAAVAVAFGCVSTVFAADAKDSKDAKGPTVSQASGKDLALAQKALNAQKYDEAIADLDKVKANPKKTDYDEYAMNQFYYNTYVAEKKLDLAAAPLETLLMSQFMTPDEKKRFTIAAAYLNYELKNYDKTIQYGTQAISDGNAPAQLQTVVAQAYYLTNDYKNTQHVAGALMDDEIKSGQKPTEELLELGESAAVKLNDTADLTRWLVLLVSNYPKPEYWQNVVDDMYHTKMTDPQLLQLYRLSAEVGVLKTGSDYNEMAQLALDAGSPGEAVATLNAGIAANAYTDAAEKTRGQRLLDSAKKQAAADQPTLAKTEAESTNAATGDRLVSVGVGYFGYGNYPEAIKDLSAGLAKGMAKDANDARLLLGIARLRSGDKPGAADAFGQVKGDAVRERLAALWTVRAKA